MRHSHILILAVFLSGCSAAPLRMAETGNDKVTAALIGRVDGCNIWRIRDGNDQTIYFARCNGSGAASTSWDTRQAAGKTVVIKHNQTLGDL